MQMGAAQAQHFWNAECMMVQHGDFNCAIRFSLDHFSRHNIEMDVQEQDSHNGGFCGIGSGTVSSEQQAMASLTSLDYGVLRLVMDYLPTKKWCTILPAVFTGARHATMQGRKRSRDRENYEARVKAAKLYNTWPCGTLRSKIELHRELRKAAVQRSHGFKNSAIAVDNEGGKPVAIIYDNDTFEHTWGPESMEAVSKHRAD